MKIYGVYHYQCRKKKSKFLNKILSNIRSKKNEKED